MDDLPKSDLLRFVERAVTLASSAVARYSSKFSKRRYTLRQHAVLLCLKVKKTTTYRDLVDERIEMPRIRDSLDLDSIPAPSTLCKAFDRLEMAVWRVLLTISVGDLPLNGVTGIDASGFERTHASAHYTKRTNLTIQQLKTTMLVDTATNAVVGIHVTTTRKFVNLSAITTLVLVARQQERLQSVANELESTWDISTITLSKDLSHPESAQEIYSEVERKGGAYSWIRVRARSAPFSRSRTSTSGWTSSQRFDTGSTVPGYYS